MSSTINASTASGGGVITTADASGILQLQTAGTTALTIDASQKVTFAKSILTSATAVASTSGTSIDFTGIPSWVKRITVMFNGVSTNGTSNIQVQIGAGSVEITGYNSGAFDNSVGAHSLAGFIVCSQNAAGAAYGGAIGVCNVSGNIWTSSGSISSGGSAYLASSGGYKTTASTLDRIRITTVNGTDTFDAGSINIMYE
jgi:hypothetical protein